MSKSIEMSDEIRTILTKGELAQMLRVSVRTIERHLSGKEYEPEVILFNRWRALRIGNRWRFQEIILQEA